MLKAHSSTPPQKGRIRHPFTSALMCGPIWCGSQPQDLSIERMDASVGETVSVKFLEVDEVSRCEQSLAWMGWP